MESINDDPLFRRHSDNAYGEIAATSPEFYKELLLSQCTAENLYPGRLEQVDRLLEKQWFLNTSFDLQLEITGLPANHDGFVDWMADRPDVIGGKPVTRLVKLPRANYALIPVWEQILDRGEAYEAEHPGERYQLNQYEAVSWRHGPLSGVKTLVLVRPSMEEEPTHVVALSGPRFATGEEPVIDGIGGFSEGGGIADDTMREVREETGVEDLVVLGTQMLGRNKVDPGMTNNEPVIGLVSIGSDQAARIPKDPVNLDPREMPAGVLVLPIEQFAQLAAKTGGILGTIMLRALTPENTDEPARRALLRALTPNIGNAALAGTVAQES